MIHLVPTLDFPEKLLFLTPSIGARRCAYQEVRNVSLSQNITLLMDDPKILLIYFAVLVK